MIFSEHFLIFLSMGIFLEWKCGPLFVKLRGERMDFSPISLVSCRDEPRGGLVSIPQCIAVLDHCIHIINSPAQLAQCSLAVVVNTSHKIGMY